MGPTSSPGHSPPAGPGSGPEGWPKALRSVAGHRDPLSWASAGGDNPEPPPLHGHQPWEVGMMTQSPHSNIQVLINLFLK